MSKWHTASDLRYWTDKASSERAAKETALELVRHLERRLAGERILRWVASGLSKWSARFDEADGEAGAWVFELRERGRVVRELRVEASEGAFMPEATGDVIGAIAEEPGCPAELRGPWEAANA